MLDRPLRHLLTAGLLAAAVASGAAVAQGAVIGKDDRRSFSEYARHYRMSLMALRWRFAASGLLDCPGRLASAQLVGSRWTILTTAHNLLDDDGRFPWSLATCVFVMTGLDGRTIEHRVSTRGFRLGTRFPARDRYRDWAVLTLEAPAPDTIKPYEVANPTWQPIPRRAAIVVVAASQDNWRGHSRRVASIERCRLRGIRVRINGHRNLLGFDCDTGRGASGAALLVPVPTGYRLIGIGVGERSRRRGAPYDGVTQFNAAVPAHAAIYRAVKALAKRALAKALRERRRESQR